MVGIPSGQHDLGPEFGEFRFEALGLGDPAEAGHPASLQQVESASLAGEDILEVERMMDALDDAGPRVQPGDALPERRGLAVALGQEDDAGPGEV